MQTYLNTAHNALIIGWRELPEYCQGNQTPLECGGPRYCTHDHSKGVFVFHNGDYGRLDS